MCVTNTLTFPKSKRIDIYMHILISKYISISLCFHPSEAYLTDPAVCYILDGILLFYCIVVTALFFNIKVRFINFNNSTSNFISINQCNPLGQCV